MRARLLATIAIITLIAAATLGWTAFRDAPSFPHATHAKLFLSCASCHGGVTSGDEASLYPSRNTCTNCHDGKTQKTVSWTTAARPITNLKFSHLPHTAAAHNAGQATTCISCHASAKDTAWMHVGRADQKQCATCHVTNDHYGAGNACTTCHVTLAEARALPDSVIARFPKPASHTSAGFVLAHAPKSNTDLASCATCHARESCARCHPNASQQPQIAQLASDARVARLVAGKRALYPTPTNHQRAEWHLRHGGDAQRSPKECANCHTQSSCTTCHTGSAGSKAISALPKGGAGTAPGVQLASAQRSAAPEETTTVKSVSVHPYGFLGVHKTSASSAALNCQGCHQPKDCTSCHSGTAPANTYHPVDFVSRHGTDAFRQSANCSTCHRVETFCRSCHQQTGMSASGSLRGSTHAGQPLWQLQHGQAARQGLTGCTSCHQQRDCLRCHSSLGQGISPHGSTFDARAVAKRNAQVCTVCHMKDPLRK